MNIRIQRITKLVQKTLGDIMLQETHRLLSGNLITVTEVQVSPDLGLAKVYLSTVRTAEGDDTLALAQQHKGTFRRLLGQRLGSKLRKVPDLRFYADNSVAYAAEIDALLGTIGIPQD
ncbi:MAG: 30S ribosome-binding factor RbfA [Bacteroidota bacterium]